MSVDVQIKSSRSRRTTSLRRLVSQFHPALLVLVVLFLVGGLVGAIVLVVPELRGLVYGQSLRSAYAPPFSGGTLLGADQLGRALEWRLLAGLAISLGTAFAVSMIATLLGLAMGLVSGMFGRFWDRVVTVLIDVTWAYPTILLAVVIAGIQGPGVSTVVWALGLTLWAAMARMVRGQVLMLREQDFVLAARALGYGRGYIAVHHLLPNLAPIWILMGTLFVALTISAEAGLSFIGIGAQSPTPSLGKTLAEAFSFASSSPWPLLFGAITIVGLVTTLNTLGDKLRDVIDPSVVVLPSRSYSLPKPLTSADHETENHAPDTVPLLQCSNLTVRTMKGTDSNPTTLMTGLSLTLRGGQTIGIVGESGSGKSVSARALAGILPSGLEQTDGVVRWGGVEVRELAGEELRSKRGKFIAMAFQDAGGSLDPLYSIGDQICETLAAHDSGSRETVRNRVLEALELVGLSEPEVFFGRYPHQLSGGQLQRAALASVLVLNPRVLICDEPTTGLDATTQVKIVALIKSLQDRLDMGVVWISHDLDLIGAVADDLIVMYAGQVVETGPVETIIKTPEHPYTLGLVQSRPTRDIAPKTTLPVIPGNVPDPKEVFTGCRFEPRCEQSLEICRAERPRLRTTLENRCNRCFNPVDHQVSEGQKA